MTHLVMLIDLLACTGCNTCSVVCKQENNLPVGVWWTQVVSVGADGPDLPAGVYPYLSLEYLPLACQHCVAGPCVEVCPSGATSRLENGVVTQDPGLCIGCRYCSLVCPYNTVRILTSDHLEYSLPFPTGSNSMVHRSRTIEKCTFCLHRLNQGLEPACVLACPMQARIFGDLDDTVSRVAELLRTRPHFQLLMDEGTRPSVYYLT